MTVARSSETHHHWLQRAAELLEEEAQALKRSFTIDDEWDPEEPEEFEYYREHIEAALAVREQFRREIAPPDEQPTADKPQRAPYVPWNDRTQEEREAYIKRAFDDVEKLRELDKTQEPSNAK